MDKYAEGLYLTNPEWEEDHGKILMIKSKDGIGSRFSFRGGYWVCQDPWELMVRRGRA